MVTWQSVLSSLATIVPTGGLTTGGLLTLFLLLIRNGKLWLGTQHDAVVAQKDEQIKLAQEAHEREIDRVLEELGRTREDRDTYSKATDLQRERADKIQEKVMDTVVPVLSGVDHALTEIARQAAEREGAG